MTKRDPLILAARLSNPWGGSEMPALDDADIAALVACLKRNKVSFLELERRYGPALMRTPLQLHADGERPYFDALRGEFERVRRDLEEHGVRTMLFKSTGLYPSFPHLSSNLDVLVPWGRGDAGRERLYHLGYNELVNVEEPVKYLFRRFSGDGLCFTFHLHEQIGWGIPFLTNESVWASARPAPDDDGVTIPCARDALLVTSAHWFYEDKVLTLENLLLTANALRSLPDGICEAVEHAAERGWREGLHLALRVVNAAWRRLYDEDALAPIDREIVDRFIRDNGYDSSRLLQRTELPADYPAQVPFLANKVYWVKKLWRDRRRSFAQKVADFWKNAVWTVRSQAHIITQKPLLVTLSGCDGSGKSVQAQGLEEAFRTCDTRVTTIWSRGASSRATGALIRVGKALFGGGREKRPHDATEDEKLAARRARLANPVARFLFAAVYAFELFWVWGVKVRWKLWKGHAVICDRYIADAYADFAVLSGLPVGETPRALRWLRSVCPRPHVAFLLDVVESEALRRKPEEGSAGHIGQARRAFKELAVRWEMRVLDAHLSQAQVYEAVVHETLAHFYLRYHTFINWLLLSNPNQMNPRAWRPREICPPVSDAED